MGAIRPGRAALCTNDDNIAGKDGTNATYAALSSSGFRYERQSVNRHASGGRISPGKNSTAEGRRMATLSGSRLCFRSKSQTNHGQKSLDGPTCPRTPYFRNAGRAAEAQKEEPRWPCARSPLGRRQLGLSVSLALKGGRTV